MYKYRQTEEQRKIEQGHLGIQVEGSVPHTVFRRHGHIVKKDPFYWASNPLSSSSFWWLCCVGICFQFIFTHTHGINIQFYKGRCLMLGSYVL